MAVTNLSIVASTAALAGVTALLNSGSIQIYSGTQPATPEIALSGNTLLATFAFTSSAFNAASHVSTNEQQTANFAALTVTAPAFTGGPLTATFARVYKSDGTTVIADLDVGTSGNAVVLNSTAITAGGNVTLTSFLAQIATV